MQECCVSYMYCAHLKELEIWFMREAQKFSHFADMIHKRSNILLEQVETIDRIEEPETGIEI